MDHSTLRMAIKSIAQIESAGLLSDLESDIAAELRGWPSTERQRFPSRWPYIHFLSGIASRLLGEPFWKCEKAAKDVMLTTTRQQVVFEVIDMYVRRIDGMPVSGNPEQWEAVA